MGTNTRVAGINTIFWHSHGTGIGVSYRSMRLLDLIAQGRGAHILSDDGRELPGANLFSTTLQNCPLRYVLTDELARCATHLAFAEGDRLSACLDLIRVPAQALWVEWAEAPRRVALLSIPSLEVKDQAPARHGGALITAAADGRSGCLRSFWSALDDRAYLSPIVTHFDLDRQPVLPPPADPTLWRGETRLNMDGEPAIEELLEHLRFHFDEEWAKYYHARCRTDALRASVLRSSLGGCVFDAPMLMALFLLFGARDLLPRQEVRHERLNRIRHQGGKPPFLEHIEVSAPLDRPPTRLREVADQPISERLSPRLHHVRGHIVRRGASVFWRSPHLRGSSRLGQVRSRTVHLTFGASAVELAQTYH